ncbi:MAG: BON domain-containing protein [Planctomycetales bacterium]|nr:BON domain-containing protein [Planctomycetales bacterium]
MIDVHTAHAALDEQVSQALDSSPYVARCNLRFETHEGRVTLHGAVDSFFKKQMAQESLRGLAGVRQIDNLLEVRG